MRGGDRRWGSGFRALFSGSLVSNTGDGIRLAALPLLAEDLTSSPFLVGLVTAAQYLPWVTVAPIGGALVDRHDRRRTILVTQAWRGVVMFALAVLVLGDVVAIWHLCVVAFLITAGEILVDPSITALVPTVVDDDRLEAANGRIASVEIVTNDFTGRPVGAAAFGLAPWLPFALDAASYLGSLVPFRRLPTVDRPPVTRPVARGSLRADAAEGLRFLRHHPTLGPLTVATMAYFLGASVGISLLVVLVRDSAGGPAWSFGVVLACGAAGALVEGVALATMAATTSVAALAVIWLVAGVPAGVRIPVSRALQQRLTPNHLLGRVNVSSRMSTRGVIVVGSVASGTLAELLGVRTAFVAGGAVVLAAALLTAIALGRPAPTAR